MGQSVVIKPQEEFKAKRIIWVKPTFHNVDLKVNYDFTKLIEVTSLPAVV